MDDRLLSRYAAIARRVHALLDEPSLRQPADAPMQADDEIRGLLSDAAYRLGLYEPAMPGARLAGLPGLLAELERELDAISGEPGDGDVDDDLDEGPTAPG